MLVGYWLSGLDKTFEAFAICAATAIIVSNVAGACGSFFAIASPTIGTAFMINGPFLVFVLVYGGLFLNVG